VYGDQPSGARRLFPLPELAASRISHGNPPAVRRPLGGPQNIGTEQQHAQRSTPQTGTAADVYTEPRMGGRQFRISPSYDGRRVDAAGLSADGMHLRRARRKTRITRPRCLLFRMQPKQTRATSTRPSPWPPPTSLKRRTAALPRPSRLGLVLDSVDTTRPGAKCHLSANAAPRAARSRTVRQRAVGGLPGVHRFLGEKKRPTRAFEGPSS